MQSILVVLPICGIPLGLNNLSHWQCGMFTCKIKLLSWLKVTHLERWKKSICGP